MEEKYSTSSTNRDDRIKARRARIESRVNSRDEDGLKAKRDAPQRKQLSRGKQQIADSLLNLDKKKSSTIEHVTAIRINTDSTENQRRIEEESKHQDRLRALQDEAVQSGKQNAAVEMKWAELMEHNMPQELMREMTTQQDSCREIIDSKNQLITEFQKELKQKDEEYVKSLKQQNNDIEELLVRMSNQYKLLQEEYANELEAIEDAFLKEREELLDRNKGEIDSLFEKRRSMEMHFMEVKQEREDKYQKELDELRAKDAEDYNKLKIKLETDIQTLEQQLEEMRATYQLNTEKLEYNYRVLTERDMENSATLAQQKRKLTRLKDGLSTLMNRYHTTDQKYKTQNMELTDEYRRITKQYKDLQAKFKHFEVADNKRYEEVWRMHEQELQQIARSLIDADRVIHIQQLGLPWADRPIPHLEAPHVAPQSTMVVESGDAKEGSPAGSLDLNEELLNGLGGNQNKASTDVANQKARLMLRMIGIEASFLLDNKVKEQIAALSEENADHLRSRHILKALGAETVEDVVYLTNLFFEEKNSIGELEELRFALEKAETEEEKLGILGLKVKPDDIVQIITNYMEAKNATSAKEVAVVRPRQEESELKSTQDARKESYKREEAKFWDDMINIVSDSTDRVWSALETALHKYNKILKDRAQLVGAVTDLHQRNEELKELLNQYMSAKVEDELIIPPSQTIVIKGQKSLYR